MGALELVVLLIGLEVQVILVYLLMKKNAPIQQISTANLSLREFEDYLKDQLEREEKMNQALGESLRKNGFDELGFF